MERFHYCWSRVAGGGILLAEERYDIPTSEAREKRGNHANQVHERLRFGLLTGCGKYTR
jgi:hypothetical protein